MQAVLAPCYPNVLRAAPILDICIGIGPYQHFLMVPELVMYVIQVPILLFVHYIYY